MRNKKYLSPSADIVKFDAEEILISFLQLSKDNTFDEMSLEWK